MILGRQNIVLASEDQEEINLYNYCTKNINSKQDVEQGWYSNKWLNLLKFIDSTKASFRM